MLDSKQALMRHARYYDVKPEILEKAARLCQTISQIMSVSYLNERLILKGGTSLNLFYLQEMPRLSVDIDLNYVGTFDKQDMEKEKPILMEALYHILNQEGLIITRSPEQNHAGFKINARYNSVLGQQGELQIDLNFMYRQQLWPATMLKPQIMATSVAIPNINIHELTAGKLVALFTRKASRDLFDVDLLLNHPTLNIAKLRLAFVLYVSMSTLTLDLLDANHIGYDFQRVKNRLLPVLKQSQCPKTEISIKQWANRLTTSVQSHVAQYLLPLNENEQQFIIEVREQGIIASDYLTNDPNLQKKIKLHPAIRWQALKANRKVK